MNVALPELWMPILVSSVIIFFASFLAWMVLPHHKADWKGLTREDDFLNALRSGGVAPGQYMFPFCAGPQDLKDPEKKKRYDAGPHGALTVWPGAPNMPKNLVLTFIFYLVVGVFVAYMGSLSLQPNAEYLDVFRVTGCAAVMSYVLGLIPGAIWFGKTLRSTVMDVIDGVVYGLLTAGVFSWLWPTLEIAVPAVPMSG